MTELTIKKVDNGYIVKTKRDDDETIKVYQKLSSVETQVEAFLDEIE